MLEMNYHPVPVFMETFLGTWWLLRELSEKYSGYNLFSTAKACSVERWLPAELTIVGNFFIAFIYLISDYIILYLL